jgi:hypothetical protein
MSTVFAGKMHKNCTCALGAPFGLVTFGMFHEGQLKAGNLSSSKETCTMS